MNYMENGARHGPMKNTVVVDRKSEYLSQYYNEPALRNYFKFGDKSGKAFKVTETTADIVCIICKDGTSSRPNEIVLCDKCGIGYHQRCHEPFIKDNALEPEAPWMCVYCSNGSECPYLLNPFEAKLKNFTRSSRKHRGVTKDNQYSTEIPHFGHHHRNKGVTSHMGDYYDDRYSRLGTETSRSRARHMLGDHRVMSRHAIMDHRIPGHHGNEYYGFPERYEGSRRDRYHYPSIEVLSKRQRVVQQHKQKQSQDVWDNGYNSPRESMSNADRLDPTKVKNSGKDGPREKQRLTQDLERQRKKLKEDMERGQVLRREHNQLLTRPRTKSDGVTADDDASPDMEAEDAEERSYSSGREWGGGFEEKSSRTPSRESVRTTAKLSDSGECVETSFDENVSCLTTINVSMEKTKQLESCECDVMQNDSETTKETGNDNEGFVVEMSDMECEHSSAGEVVDNEECHLSNKRYNSPESKETIRNHRSDAVKYDEIYENGGRIFTSEKVEVIGESDDLDNTSYPPNEGETEQYPGSKGKMKKQCSHGKGLGKGQRKCHKSFIGGKTYRKTEEDEEKIKKTKEGSDAVRGGECKTNKELLNETIGSSGIDVTSVGDTEPVERNEEDEESNFGGNESGSNKQCDVQNVIAQNRVRSDLPRHNWLIERLKNEKKLPVSTCAVSSGGEVNKNLDSCEEALTSTVLKGEVTSSTKPENNELVKAAAHSTTSPILDDNDDQTYSKIISNEDVLKRYEYENQSIEHDQEQVTNLNEPSPSKNERNLISPELSFSPAITASDENKELEKRSSPNNDNLSTIFTIKTRETFRDEVSEGNKKASLEFEEESEVEDHKITKNLNEESGKDEKIIEIKSDGEGSDDVKNDENNKEKDFSKISTSKSVNPVSPFVRSERRAMDDMKNGNELRRHEMIPRSPRIPSELTPLPFINPGYFAGYSPKTFTPHLITHTAPPMPGLAAPVSPIARHATHGAIPNYHIASRLDVGGQNKPDHNCPYHGKKATDKIVHHAPGYPMIHSDHHLLTRVPFHEGLPDVATMKMREKLREQAEFDPLGIHRLPAVYDRHILMPHGIHAPMPHPRYIGPAGFIDEHSYLERELFKRRMETVYPIHDPAKYVHPHSIEEHRNSSKYIVSPSDEKLPKKVGSPSGEHRHHPKRIGSPPDERVEMSRMRTGRSTELNLKHGEMVMAARLLSPREEKYLKGNQAPNFDAKSPQKLGKQSPSPVRTTPSHPSPGGVGGGRSSYIQLGESKEGKSSEMNSHHPRQSPGGTLDQESISRDFDERLNMLNRTFKKKMEAAESMERKHGKEGLIFLDSNVPTQKTEVSYGEISSFTTNRPPDGAAQVGTLGPIRRNPYKNHESPPVPRNSPPIHNTKSLDERRKLDELESQRRFVSHKPFPMTSYRAEINNMSREHEIQAREGIPKAAYMRGVPHHQEYPHYDVVPWSVRGPPRIPGYGPVRTGNEKSVGDISEKMEHACNQREQQEKDIDLAREKHRMNLAHFEQERNKAMMNYERTHPRLPTRTSDDRDEGHPRITGVTVDQRAVRMKEEALRRDWEDNEARKRKLEEMAGVGRLSPYEKNPSEAKRLKAVAQDECMPARPIEVPGDLDPRKEHFLSMYGKPRVGPYRQHVTTVPYPGRVGATGNAPFYMGRFDLHRTKPERSVSEALRKQREFSEEQAAAQKLPSTEKDLGTSEQVKKRAKLLRMCDVCGKEASFLCSGCQKAWYCSPKCQLKAWTEHSKECSSETKRR